MNIRNLLAVAVIAVATVVVGAVGLVDDLGSAPVSAQEPAHLSQMVLTSGIDPTATSGLDSPVTPAPTPPPTATPVPAPTPPPASAPSGKGSTHILMYHYIRQVDSAKDPLGFRLSIAPDNLEQQLAAMVSGGYTFITMSQYVQGKGGDHTVALTFDDGYEDFYTTAWPLLKKYNITATAYVISGKIGGNYLTWDQVRELDAAGIEIGSHTVSHPDLSKLDSAHQQKEIQDSKTELESQLGHPVVSFCYPSGRYNDETVRLTRQAGYLSATTTQPGTAAQGDDLFTLHRVRVQPDLSTASLMALLGR